MAAKHSCHVALTASHAAYIDELVTAGAYASVSEIVRAGLRLLIEADEVKKAKVVAQANAPERHRGHHS
jgi:antitoxin ParD1/3/4